MIYQSWPDIVYIKLYTRQVWVNVHIFFFFSFFFSSFQSTWLSPAIGQINHPGGTFYWLIISQLRFHEHPPANSLTPLITHTFKVFIIKRIRLCSLNIFFLRRLFRGSAWLRFISTQPYRGSLAVSLALLPSSTRADAASLFHASVQRSLQSRCHWLLCKVTGNRGLKG